jgi:catechol 2,3-dioxygenase-like lactoylglutathione lyase family enzyme
MMSIVDHIAILVDDLEVAEEWYTQKLAGKVTFRDSKYIRMTVSNTNIALIDKNHYPHAHFGILVEKKEDLPLELGRSCLSSRWNRRSLCKRPIWELFRVYLVF